MKKNSDVVRGRVDAVDETILLALKEGAQSLKNLHILSGINYNTFRQRLNKLLRYNLLAKPKYGEYALSEKGRHFVEELAMPVAPDLKDSKLKKLIDMLPTELHRAFFGQLLSGIIAKYLLADAFEDGYPAFILGGATKSFKTALAAVMCKVLGLKPEETIYPMFSAIPGEFGIRRFRSKGDSYHITASSLFKQSFVCLDEFDKITDRDTRRNALFFLDGRNKFSAEGEPVENRTCTMLTLNTKIGKEGVARFGIPEPYIRRSIVADTEHVRTELKNIDLIAKKIFEMKDFPRIDLEKLHITGTKLPNDVFTCLRTLLLSCTDEPFQRLVDTRPLEILTLGRSALLGGDVREAMYQTLWDRLVCLESLGGTVAGWRETVAKEWAKYKREEQPEIAKQMEEAKQRDRARARAITKRATAIAEKKVERIDDQTAFILHRAELSTQIQTLIQKLGRGEPLAEPLRWLRKNIDSSRTPEDLSQYEDSFKNTTLPKVKLQLQKKKNAEAEVKWEKDMSKLVANVTKDIERKVALMKKEREQGERKRRKDEILKLRACLKPINHYLGRKELREGEDPVLILQQLRIIKPVKGILFSRVTEELVRGYWSKDRWSGKPKYSPPTHDFTDYDSKVDSLVKVIFDSKIYKCSEEVHSWTSWAAVWPLLQAKRAKYLREIAILTVSNNVEKR